MTRDGVATDPIARALWFIESHFAEEITLDDVAAVAGVSRYHLSRTFGLATGSGLMAYVRGRRLSEAAKALAAGAPDILGVALDWGYGSHEAFSRASSSSPARSATPRTASSTTATTPGTRTI